MSASAEIEDQYTRYNRASVRELKALNAAAEAQELWKALQRDTERERVAYYRLLEQREAERTGPTVWVRGKHDAQEMLTRSARTKEQRQNQPYEGQWIAKDAEGKIIDCDLSPTCLIKRVPDTAIVSYVPVPEGVFQV